MPSRLLPLLALSRSLEPQALRSAYQEQDVGRGPTPRLMPSRLLALLALSRSLEPQAPRSAYQEQDWLTEE
jgi:hypothetical protein